MEFVVLERLRVACRVLVCIVPRAMLSCILYPLTGQSEARVTNVDVVSRRRHAEFVALEVVESVENREALPCLSQIIAHIYTFYIIFALNSLPILTSMEYSIKHLLRIHFL